jgi:hypothetical protein
MGAEQGVTLFLKMVVEGLPTLVALGIGCALCILSLRKHRRAAIFALAGGGLLLVNFFGARVFSAFLMPVLYRIGGGSSGLLRSGVTLFLSLIFAAGIGLLFYAVFEGRGQVGEESGVRSEE